MCDSFRWAKFRPIWHAPSGGDMENDDLTLTRQVNNTGATTLKKKEQQFSILSISQPMQVCAFHFTSVPLYHSRSIFFFKIISCEKFHNDFLSLAMPMPLFRSANRYSCINCPPTQRREQFFFSEIGKSVVPWWISSLDSVRYQLNPTELPSLNHFLSLTIVVEEMGFVQSEKKRKNYIRFDSSIA